MGEPTCNFHNQFVWTGPNQRWIPPLVLIYITVVNCFINLPIQVVSLLWLICMAPKELRVKVLLRSAVLILHFYRTCYWYVTTFPVWISVSSGALSEESVIKRPSSTDAQDLGAASIGCIKVLLKRRDLLAVHLLFGKAANGQYPPPKCWDCWKPLTVMDQLSSRLSVMLQKWKNGRKGRERKMEINSLVMGSAVLQDKIKLLSILGSTHMGQVQSSLSHP